MSLIAFARKFLPALAMPAAVAVAPVRALAKAVINRREIIRLTELDERGLKDLGLVRSDVEGALASFWHVDPSAVLERRREAAGTVAAARREAAAAEPERRVPELRPPAPAPLRDGARERPAAKPALAQSPIACSA